MPGRRLFPMFVPMPADPGFSIIEMAEAWKEMQIERRKQQQGKLVDWRVVFRVLSCRFSSQVCRVWVRFPWQLGARVFPGLQCVCGVCF